MRIPITVASALIALSRGQTCDKDAKPTGSEGTNYWASGGSDNGGNNGSTEKPTSSPDDPTSSPLPDTEVKTPGINYDDMEKDLEEVTGPTDKAGNCVWPFVEGGAYQTGAYASAGGKVYQAKYYMSSKPPGEGWTEVASCTGEPAAPYTDEEAAAIAAKKIASASADTYPAKGTRIAWVFDPWNPNYPTPAGARTLQQSMINGIPLAKEIMAAYTTLDVDKVEAVTPGASTNPENVKRVESFLTPKLFSQLTPCRAPEYSYENLLKAIAAYPEYCKTYTDGRDSDKICKILISTSFAHYAQETGNNSQQTTADECKSAGKGDDEGYKFWKAGGPSGSAKTIPMGFQALWYLREVGYDETTTSSAYEQCDPSQDQWAVFYPCPGNATYFGRGSKQLSYNYNYAPFSTSCRKDTFYLLDRPDLLATSWLNLASGIWFAVTPQSPKPSMVWVLDGTWQPNDADKANGLAPGFGATIVIINGGLECGQANNAQATGRQNKLKDIITLIPGLTESDFGKLDCATGKEFPAAGAAVSPLYLAHNDGYECILVSYVTPFMVTINGDYSRCIDWNLRSRIYWGDKLIFKYGAKASR